MANHGWVKPEAEDATPPKSENEIMREAIDELLIRAYKYDDKPHRLYSQIMQMASMFEEDDTIRKEIHRLMDKQYKDWNSLQE